MSHPLPPSRLSVRGVLLVRLGFHESGLNHFLQEGVPWGKVVSPPWTAIPGVRIAFSHLVLGLWKKRMASPPPTGIPLSIYFSSVPIVTR